MKMPTKTPKRVTAAAAAALGLAALLTVPWRAASGGDAEQAPQNPEAQAVLDRLAAAYADVEAYAGEATMTQRVVEGGAAQESEARFELALRQPNSFRVKLVSERGDWLFVSDGQDYAVHFSQSDKYLMQPAPGTLAEALQSEPLSLTVPERLRPVVFGLFGPDVAEALQAGAQSVEHAGEEEIDGRAADHVVVHTAEDSLHLWVTRDEPDLVRATLDPRAVLEQVKAVRPAITEIKLTVDRTRTAEPDGIAFAFEPGPDARRALDMEDLLRVDLEGRPMVEFELPGLQEGEQWRLADHLGKVIALDFWATWCGPCRLELPHLQEIHRDYRDRDFLLLGVNVGETREEVRAFLEDEKLDINVAMDSAQTVFAEHAGSGIPMLVLIGKTGRIEAVHRGYSEGLENVVREQIDTLLRGESLLPAD